MTKAGVALLFLGILLFTACKWLKEEPPIPLPPPVPEPYVEFLEFRYNGELWLPSDKWSVMWHLPKWDAAFLLDKFLSIRGFDFKRLNNNLFFFELAHSLVLDTGYYSLANNTVSRFYLNRIIDDFTPLDSFLPMPDYDQWLHIHLIDKPNKRFAGTFGGWLLNKRTGDTLEITDGKFDIIFEFR